MRDVCYNRVNRYRRDKEGIMDFEEKKIELLEKIESHLDTMQFLLCIGAGFLVGFFIMAPLVIKIFF